MRELPLNVWKTRRKLVSCSTLDGSACSAVSAPRAVSSTSRASSRKMSRISASASSPVSSTAAAGTSEISGSGAETRALSRPTGSDAVETKSASASATCSRALASVCRLAYGAAVRSMEARALDRLAANWDCDNTSGSSESRSSSRETWANGISRLEAALASDCAWAISAGSRRETAASCNDVLRRTICETSRPLAASKRNIVLATCGCTPSKSIRKLRALRLPARRSNSGCWWRASVPAVTKASTSSRMRSTASVAWSSPSTENTPRIACNCAGTGISTAGSVGARKNWSMSFSDSDSALRSSCTTLPMVWRSETRR